MDFFETVRARHSIRAFTAEPVEAEQIHTILQAASRAPSAGNLQAYEIYVVADRGALGRLTRAALDQPCIAQAALALVFCAHPARSAGKYGQRGKALYSVQDATIACVYAQLAATALGLASVWIGAFDEEGARKALGLEEGLRPVAILPIGHAAEKPEVTSRRPLTTLAHYITTSSHSAASKRSHLTG